MRAPLLAVVAGGALAAGCGTVASLAQPDDSGRVYGGVRRDLDWAMKVIDGPADSNGPLMNSGGDGRAGALFAAVLILGPVLDVPLSLVGDTVTLPLARWLDTDR
ncbi:YceK/YidQ family lipoprotein [bacterium]|nr:YceK/YidQ family lipoprotein [bacterium]